MKNKQWFIFVVTLLLIAGTAGALAWLRANQKLGKPGVIAEPIPGQVTMKIGLPENVGDFTSTNVPEPDVVLGYLPKDTSYAERIYTAPDGFWVQATIILMGADRTSIHNADFCLSGTGFSGREKSFANIPIAGPQPYQLSVSRWNLSGIFAGSDGQKIEQHGIYVFWFVADGEQTPDHLQMMKWLARDLLTRGILQRWAYVSYFALCEPGQEDATFERMKKLIGDSVAGFQYPPRGKTAGAVNH